MNPTCCDCMYYQLHKKTLGTCRCKSPIPVYDTEIRRSTTVWPKVLRDNWCGQFKSAKSETIAVDEGGSPVVDGTSEKE